MGSAYQSVDSARVKHDKAFEILIMYMKFTVICN